MLFYTNLRLAEEGEHYESPHAMLEGSPVAQALGRLDGIAAASLEEGSLTIWRDPFFDWYAIAADVSAVLKDFFL